eukprot:2876535-Lingulodinium_polyedra.AAC.1
MSRSPVPARLEEWCFLKCQHPRGKTNDFNGGLGATFADEDNARANLNVHGCGGRGHVPVSNIELREMK